MKMRFFKIFLQRLKAARITSKAAKFYLTQTRERKKRERGREGEKEDFLLLLKQHIFIRIKRVCYCWESVSVCVNSLN